MKNIHPFISVTSLVTVTILFRLIAYVFYGDTQLENEWQILVHNLTEQGVLGINVVVSEFIALPKLASSNELVLPSVFMPPLYSFFIFIIKYTFSNFFNYVNIIILLQIILNTLTVFFLFRIIKFNNSKSFSFLFALIFSLIPLNIYSSVQISSICLQVFLLTYLLYILKKISVDQNYTNLIIFSILSSLLILVRGEFFLFYFFILFYFFVYNYKNVKYLIISITITSFLISPYLIRNYKTFNEIILTKSLGYNLLKGNNIEFKVEGNLDFIEKEYNRAELKIPTDNNYEIRLDDFYKNQAIEFITKNPTKFFLNYFLKVFSFLFFDFNSTYQNYYNILHLLPKILLSFTSLIGAILVIRKRSYLQFLSLYYFLNIFFFSIFFILPRYSLILLPIQILLTIEFYKFCLRKFSN